MSTTPRVAGTVADAILHNTFLDLLPRLQTHAAIAFRHIPCPAARADCIAETLALAWRWLGRLQRRGKAVSQFPMVFIILAARAVRCGRRLVRQESARDVLSPTAQRRHGFRVQALPAQRRVALQELYGEVNGQRYLDAYEECLGDNRRSAVPDQVAFRLDFAAWLARLTARERRLIHAMAQRERTKDLSRRFQLSPGRISQLRRQFQQEWERFWADPADAQPAAPAGTVSSPGCRCRPTDGSNR